MSWIFSWGQWGHSHFSCVQCATFLSFSVYVATFYADFSFSLIQEVDARFYCRKW